ncbi:MAG: dihydrofolate reductase [Candidatus Paceibacterota bacterium]
MDVKKAKIIIVVAIGSNRVIGKGNNLLWRIPDDMKRFRDLTMGYPIIMGRKTYESLPEKYRPLPGRENIIITRDQEYKAPGAKVTNSIKEGIEYAKSLGKEKVFIGGGAEIYKQALPFTDLLYLTLIEESKDGDAYFPDYSEFNKELFKEEREYKDLNYSWINLSKS